MSSVAKLLQWGRQQLIGSDEALCDTQVLLCHVLKKDRAWLFAWSDREIDAHDEIRYHELIGRRAEGIPVAHLTGKRGFWSLQLAVDEHTLIPRPETEHLVEKALQLGDAGLQLKVLDLGTGSGAIALAIASERPRWQVTAVERSEQALQVAENNAKALALRNLRLLRGDWFHPVQGRYHLVVSNPPYVAENDPHLSRGDLRFEPAQALASGPDGLDDIRHIVKTAPHYLEAGGWLLFEHGYDQAAACREMLQESGFSSIFCARDLAGHERLSGGKIPLDRHGN